MTEISQLPPEADEPQADEGAPVPGAAPAPVPPRDRIAELEAELAMLRAAAVTGEHVLLRVLRPHVSFTYAGRTVGTEPTPVPARAVSEMTQAADRSGVTLKEG